MKPLKSSTTYHITPKWHAIGVLHICKFCIDYIYISKKDLKNMVYFNKKKAFAKSIIMPSKRHTGGILCNIGLNVRQSHSRTNYTKCLQAHNSYLANFLLLYQLWSVWGISIGHQFPSPQTHCAVVTCKFVNRLDYYVYGREIWILIKKKIWIMTTQNVCKSSHHNVLFVSLHQQTVPREISLL